MEKLSGVATPPPATIQCGRYQQGFGLRSLASYQSMLSSRSWLHPDPLNHKVEKGNCLDWDWPPPYSKMHSVGTPWQSRGQDSAFTAQSLGSIHGQGTKILQAVWHGGGREKGFRCPNPTAAHSLPDTLCSYLPLKQAHLSTYIYPGPQCSTPFKAHSLPLTPLLPLEQVPAPLKQGPSISTPHPSHTPNTTAWRLFIPTDNHTPSRPPLRRPCHLPGPCNLHLRSTDFGLGSQPATPSQGLHLSVCMTLLIQSMN